MSNGAECCSNWEELNRLVSMEKMTDWYIGEAYTFIGSVEKVSEEN